MHRLYSLMKVTIDSLSSMWAKVLLLLTFSLYPCYSAPIKIAILDTYFCPKLIMTPKNIQINTVIDNSHSHKSESCSTYSKKNRLFHGQWVLEEFINNIKIKDQIIIQPISIFNSSGVQDIESWKKAFNNQEKYDLFLVAAGVSLKKESIIFPNFIRPVITAGSTYGKGINKKSLLWPQSEYKNDFVITIGSYLEENEDLGTRDDYNLIFKKRMKFFFSAGIESSHFKGTSFAVAVATSRLLSLCEKQVKSHRGLYKCLESNRKLITLKESKKKIPTF